MNPNSSYLSPTEAPSRAEVERWQGLTLLEFGSAGCGHCRAAQAPVAEALAGQTQWQHLLVEDGAGRALGRSFHVKLWPTLVLLRDGQEVGRLVRPRSAPEVAAALSGADGSVA